MVKPLKYWKAYYIIWIISLNKNVSALTGHILAIMEWICLVLLLLSVSFSLKKKYTLASLGSVPSGITCASTNIGSCKRSMNSVWVIKIQLLLFETDNKCIPFPTVINSLFIGKISKSSHCISTSLKESTKHNKPQL